MNRKTILLVALLCLCCTVLAFAQTPPKLSPPEGSGFSSDRLSRITTFFQNAIDNKAIPGVVVVVVRDGKCVYLQALGFQEREKNTPMKPDAIFRIASMTKPITSVAVMMLAEQGKIDLLAPVSLYLPEFKDVKVGVTKNALSNQPTLSLEPPQRPMTVQDLLRHTSGLVYGPFGETLVHQAYNKANLFDHNQNLSEFVTKLSKLPLAHQPGSAWEYGMSIDVLGRIVEVVSGMPFDQFLRERITNPLKMNDTAFYLDAAQALRLAEMQLDPETGQRPATTFGPVFTVPTFGLIRRRNSLPC
jgi:CubicO group peptidase (beta-lactamase class C family)